MARRKQELPAIDTTAMIVRQFAAGESGLIGRVQAVFQKDMTRAARRLFRLYKSNGRSTMRSA